MCIQRTYRPPKKEFNFLLAGRRAGDPRIYQVMGSEIIPPNITKIIFSKTEESLPLMAIPNGNEGYIEVIDKIEKEIILRMENLGDPLILQPKGIVTKDGRVFYRRSELEPLSQESYKNLLKKLKN